MWRDPRQNRWQQRVNKQAKRTAERDEYLARLAKRDLDDHIIVLSYIERLRLDAERLGIRL